MRFIPFIEDPQFREQIDLDNQTFILIFKWNALNEYWTMDILNGNLIPIVYGIKIVTQFNLTEQIVQTGMPLGDILCQNIVGGFETIVRDSMTTTNQLVYYDVAV